jgi:hypothetical protein
MSTNISAYSTVSRTSTFPVTTAVMKADRDRVPVSGVRAR